MQQQQNCFKFSAVQCRCDAGKIKVGESLTNSRQLSKILKDNGRRSFKGKAYPLRRAWSSCSSISFQLRISGESEEKNESSALYFTCDFHYVMNCYLKGMWWLILGQLDFDNLTFHKHNIHRKIPRRISELPAFTKQDQALESVSVCLSPSLPLCCSTWSHITFI